MQPSYKLFKNIRRERGTQTEEMTGKGAFFGEAALMSTEPRVATVRATAAGDCYVLTKVSTALSDYTINGVCSDELL